MGAACLSAVTATAATEYERTLERSFTVQPGHVLELRTGKADIEVRPAAAGQPLLIKVHKKVEARSQEDADKILDSIETLFDQGAYAVNAEVKNGEPGLRWFGFVRVYPEIDVSVQLPPDMRLQMTSGSGDMDLSDLTGNFVCASGSGDIDAKRLSGSLSAKTGSGDLDVEEVSGQLLFESGSGDLEADGAFPVFTITTASGDAEIRSSIQPQAPASIRTASGDIHLSLPADARIQVEARTASGSVKAEFPAMVKTTAEERNALTGHTDPNAPTILLRSASGDIRLKAH
jgi:hypothetical protein